MLVLNFQSPAVILEEHGDGSPIRVCWHSSTSFVLQLSRRDRGIVKKSKLVIVPRVESEHELGICQAKTGANGFEDFSGCLGAFPIEARHEFPEAGEDFFWEPDVGLFVVFLTSNLIALLRSLQFWSAIYGLREAYLTVLHGS